MDLGQRLREMQDDAVESQKLEPQQPDHATLGARINDYLADRLTSPQMKKLSDEYGPQIDAEIQRGADTAQRKKELDEKTALRIFSGVHTDAEERAARQACWEFGQKHSTVLSILKNQLTLLEEVANRKQFVTVPNLDSAYKFLWSQGAFEEPIEPVQSAEQFKADHIEDWPKQSIPPLVMAGIEKVLDTFSANHPEYVHTESNKDKIMAALPRGVPISLQLVEEAFHNVRAELDLSNASQRGEVLRYTDMGGRPQGFPKESEKYSFKIKIRSMTADQIAQRCLDDPAFKQALDNL